MMPKLKRFLRDNEAQDLIEYTLLLAFVCLLCAGIMMGTGTSVSGIWGASNSTLTTANTSASGASAAPSQPTGGGGGHGGDGGDHGDR